MPRKAIGDRARYLNIDVERLEPESRKLLQKRLDVIKKELGTDMENLALRVLLVRLLKLEQELGK